MKSLVAGVDIGGSHITAALIDLEKRQVKQDTVYRETVDACGDINEIIYSWSTAIEKSVASISDEIFIGIAMPGPFDYGNGICHIKEQNKFRAFYGINVKEALAKALHISPSNIKFLNDAASFLKGEVFSGAAQGYDYSFGVTLGTGFGSAICKSGEATDAEMWCSKFRDGIAEDYFSTGWFVRQYSERTGKLVENVKDLAGLFAEDPEVQEIFKDFGEHLASFFNQNFQKEQPEVIVIGGNIAQSFDYFYPSLQRNLKQNKMDVPVKKAELHEFASLLGAASCWSYNTVQKPIIC